MVTVVLGSRIDDFVVAGCDCNNCDCGLDEWVGWWNAGRRGVGFNGGMVGESGREYGLGRFADRSGGVGLIVSSLLLDDDMLG